MANKTEKIKSINLTGLQIKTRLEAVLSYDHEKYGNLAIPFETKKSLVKKLPFSDYKVSISEELEDHAALQENINKLLTYKYQEAQYKKQEKVYNEYLNKIALLENKQKEIEEAKKQEIFEIEEKIIDEETLDAIAPEPVVEKVEEIIEIAPVAVVLSEEVEKEKEKKPKTPKTKAIKVDTLAIIEKIKQEAREKNKGKKVIGRREVNKLLDPFGLKAKMRKDLGPTAEDDDILTSIDIYLNAVDKISANANAKPASLYKKEDMHNTQELKLEEIIKDIE